MSTRFFAPLGGAVCLLCFFLSASAQPPQDTRWLENVLNSYVTVEFDSAAVDGEGVDELVPEPLAVFLDQAGVDLLATVEFPSEGPPQATVQAGGSATAGFTSVISRASVSISFEARVVAVTQPPVAVESVPVSVRAVGITTADGAPGFTGSGIANFKLFEPGGGGEIADIVAASTGTTEVTDNDEFDETVFFSLEPDIVVVGTLDAVAQATGVGGGSAHGLAIIDPIFEVSDDLIPGTAFSYSDIFAFEFGDGYMIPDITPTEALTWGELKRRFDRR